MTEETMQQLDLPRTTRDKNSPIAQEQSAEQALELIEKIRQNGSERIARHLDHLTSRELMSDPKLESALRDIASTLQATKETVEAMNSLLDIIKHDLILTVVNVGRQGEALIHQGARGLEYEANLKATLRVLMKKEVILTDELKETWAEIAKEMGIDKKEEDQQPTEITQPV